jgi:HSP20 family molecular chaperone IbpA
MQFGFLSGVDIIDDADRLQVIVDFPGVKEDDISVVVQATTLKISSRAIDRKSHPIFIDLGIPVKGEPSLRYRNGVLEVSLGKEWGIMENRHALRNLPVKVEKTRAGMLLFPSVTPAIRGRGN